MIDNCRVYDPKGCIECDPGYAVFSNQHGCIKLSENGRIEKCHIHDYAQFSATKCTLCRRGYTNSEDKLSCVRWSQEIKDMERTKNCRYLRSFKRKDEKIIECVRCKVGYTLHKSSKNYYSSKCKQHESGEYEGCAVAGLG